MVASGTTNATHNRSAPGQSRSRASARPSVRGTRPATRLGHEHVRRDSFSWPRRRDRRERAVHVSRSAVPGVREATRHEPHRVTAVAEDTAGRLVYVVVGMGSGYSEASAPYSLISRHRVTLLRCLDMRTSGPYRVYTPDSLGAAIRHYRQEVGLTQEELAKRAGLNRTYLSDLERGKETEQLRRVLRVLRQLGVRMTLERADW